MVKPFTFARLPLVLFGPGRISGLPRFVKSYGSKTLLVTGKSSFLSSASGKNLLNSFSETGITYTHIVIPGEPSPEMIAEAVAVLEKNRCDLVVAIGGGSVLDAGKAISAMSGIQYPVTDFLEGVGTREHPGTKLPFIAVPTTSGTGSEATKNAVISRTGINGFKRSLRHENFVPDVAIVDPELTLGCPKEITAAGGMDCFTQLTEAYLSDKSNEYTDALAFEGIKEIKNSLLASYNSGSDIVARSGMSFAALTSGICLANAGLGAVHGFASSIGGMYDIPHGVICGTLMAKANEINVRLLRRNGNSPDALKKYARLGELFSEAEGKSDDFYIDGFIDILHSLTSELNLPGLKNAGVRAEDLAAICKSTDCKNNPVKLDYDELYEIAESRFL
jgi:alcohol dehydrogenase class IV